MAAAVEISGFDNCAPAAYTSGRMFERYTEPSRRVVFYARYFAAQTGSPKIETEHLLLGLLRTDMVLARRFLGSPWVAEEVWREIEQKRQVRAPIPPGIDIPLSAGGKRTLLFAAEEADQASSKKIRTEHLLLGLLRDEGGLAGTLLKERSLQSAPTRDQLNRAPHDDSIAEEFVREPDALPADVAESRDRLRSIVSRMEQALANHDFATARSFFDEERNERDKLQSLYRQHGLSGWIFE